MAEISYGARQGDPYAGSQGLLVEKEMRFFSMFSGIGTAEQGIEQAFNIEYAHVGSEPEPQERSQGRLGTTHQRRTLLHAGNGSAALCVGFSEIDKHAIAIYRYHYPNVRNYGDATNLVPESLPDFDFLVAGFPCQAFSIAGKRQGFDDARGTLFFEIARVLSHKRPAHFLLENVGGLRSHDGGKTLQRILGVLSDLGYFVEVPLLNSKDYGVPQNRERVFFIGHLGERCSREILSVGADGREAFELSGQSANCLTARYYGAQAVGTYITERELNAQEMIQLDGTRGAAQGARIYGADGIAQTISSGGGGLGAKTGLYAVPVLTPDRPTKRQNGRRFKEDGEEAFTLTAQDRHGVFNGSRIRRLTPIECERLQGLEDGYTKLGMYEDGIKEVSDTQRYKTCGNGMTTTVIEAIVSRMKNKGCL